MKTFALLAWCVFLCATQLHGMDVPDASLYLASQEFITATEAEKKWGKEAFSVEKFRKASQRERSAMAANLTRAKELLGKKPSEIKALLGDFSGHFWSDAVPTYLIEEGWQKNENTWQLVFLLDHNGNVAEIKIHKNCCAERK